MSKKLYKVSLFNTTNFVEIIKFQDDIEKTIEAKKDSVPRFDAIQTIWVGGEYWSNEEKWKWRNSYVAFNGKICLQFGFEI